MDNYYAVDNRIDSLESELNELKATVNNMRELLAQLYSEKGDDGRDFANNYSLWPSYVASKLKEKYFTYEEY